jgi:hypothetical protein
MTYIVDFLDARLEEDFEAAANASQDGDAGNTWTVGARQGSWRQEARIGDDREDLVFDVKDGACVGFDELLAYLVRFHPSRALQDVAAKRAIIDEHSSPHTVVDGFCGECGRELPDGIHTKDQSYCQIHGFRECDTLLHIATVYDDHPDYQTAWRPAS